MREDRRQGDGNELSQEAILPSQAVQLWEGKSRERKPLLGTPISQPGHSSSHSSSFMDPPKSEAACGQGTDTLTTFSSERYPVPDSCGVCRDRVQAADSKDKEQTKKRRCLVGEIGQAKGELGEESTRGSATQVVCSLTHPKPHPSGCHLLQWFSRHHSWTGSIKKRILSVRRLRECWWNLRDTDGC